MVINETNVDGYFTFLEDAKERLNLISSGPRLIAEVDSPRRLNRNPKTINGQLQSNEMGFNWYWRDDDDSRSIDKLMDIGQAYLDSMGN